MSRSLVGLIDDLATYEREPDAVEVDDDLLTTALFAESPVVFANVADDDGDVLGMTIYFRNFSTWTGRLGIYLEDLYVRPEARGRGVGAALLTALADEARANGYSRIDWSVLDWNEPPLAFYRSIGAVPMTGGPATGCPARPWPRWAPPTGRWIEPHVWSDHPPTSVRTVTPFGNGGSEAALSPHLGICSRPDTCPFRPSSR